MKPIEGVSLGGTGNKLVRICFEEIDTNIELRTWSRFWDVCAPEAVIKGLGGMVVMMDPLINHGKIERPVYF